MCYIGPFRQVLICILAICVTHLTSISPEVSAQTAPITSSGLNTQISAPIQVDGQTQYNITGGTRPEGGANLFHSFGEFGVPNNTIANFYNNSGVETSNILGRVTGGNTSNIFGSINTTDFGSANLFLMNPAGFLFGPNATVNVGGMVTFTTADYIRLVDEKRFNSVPNLTTDTLLTASPIAAFGFLGSNPAAITVQGSQLMAIDGTGISLVGGDITLTSGILHNGTARPAQLSAPNGYIRLASRVSPGEFNLALDAIQNINEPSFTSFASVTLAPGSTVNLSGTDTVSIRGGQFVPFLLQVNDAVLTTAESTGPLNSISLGPNTSIISSTTSTEPGPNIQLNAATIDFHLATITALSSENSAGKAGEITLTATHRITAVDSFLNTNAEGEAGLAGDILLRAPTISLQGGVLSASTFGGIRPAGNILLEGQQISLEGSPFAAAQGVDLFTGTLGSGHGGTITIRGMDGPASHAKNVMITENSRFHTGTFSEGNGGDITIRAAQFILTDNARLFAGSSGPGRGGMITISASESATISGHASELSSSSDGGIGNAGQITVTAPTVTIANGGKVFTTTSGEGTGGNIVINAGQSATLTNGAKLSANSTGTGDAGNIQIYTGQTFLATNSSVTTQANSASGGTIKITTPPTGRVELTNSMISASVLDGTAGGGSVNIDPQFTILQNSQILAQAVQGPGGNVSISTNLLLQDANSAISSSSQFGVNGTVTIQSPSSPAGGRIHPLGNRPLQASLLLNQRCAALAGGEFSSFTVVGRTNLHIEPGGWLASPSVLTNSQFGHHLPTETSLRRSFNKQPGESSRLSLRQISPAGFLTQAFAIDRSTGCSS